MVKKTTQVQKQSQPSTTPVESKKRAAAFEIDDIFAAKKNKTDNTATVGGSSKPSVSSDSQLETLTAEKGKKSKKTADKAAGGEDSAQAIKKTSEGTRSKRVPETVVDTSANIIAYQPPPPPKNAAADGQASQEEEKFMDSRGTRARTDDGLAIYSVEELNIGRGGGTPDCPFDCQCCF